MTSMAVGGTEITSDPTAQSKAFSAAGALRGALTTLADLLLPPVCIACRKRVGAHGLLCGDCWTKIDFIAPPLCERLGVPLPYETGSPSLSAWESLIRQSTTARGPRRAIPRPCAS